MKLKIQKNVLLEALQLIVSIAPKATSDRAINNVLLETTPQGVSFKATNFDVSFWGQFPATIDEPGRCCLPIAKMFNLVRNFTASEVTLETTQQLWAMLSSGYTQIRLPGMDPDSFPPVTFGNLASSFLMPADQLKLTIDRTFFAIGENESRKNLMGLNLQVKEPGKLAWMGADAFRISRNETQIPGPTPDQGSIIIPKKSLVEVKKILDHSAGEIKVSFDDNVFQLETGDLKFKTRLIEADYPNLDSILSAMGPNKINLPKAELLRSVRILNTLYDADPNAVMKLTLKQDRVVVESQKLEGGEGMDVIYADYQGEEMSIGINIQFMLDALQVMESGSDAMITFHFTGPVQPCFLTSHAWPEFKIVLMPVKIKW